MNDQKDKDDQKEKDDLMAQWAILKEATRLALKAEEEHMSLPPSPGGYFRATLVARSLVAETKEAWEAEEAWLKNTQDLRIKLFGRFGGFPPDRKWL